MQTKMFRRKIISNKKYGTVTVFLNLYPGFISQAHIRQHHFSYTKFQFLSKEAILVKKIAFFFKARLKVIFVYLQGLVSEKSVLIVLTSFKTNAL